MSTRIRRPSDGTATGAKAGWWIGGLLAVAIAALALVWLFAGTETVLSWFGIADDAQSAGDETGVNLSEVSDNPDAMYGQMVTISGGVQEIITPHAITIGNDEPLVGDTVLVVGADDFDTSVTEEDAILVTGEVQRFEIGAVEGALGVDLDDEALADYDGKAVLVASEVEVNPANLGPGDTEQQGPSAGFDINADISDITGEPDTYLGQQVTVSGEVEKVLDSHAFLFGDEKLLAVSADPRDDLFVEPTAYVRGEVREFNLVEIEEEFGIDLDDRSFAEFDGEPFIAVEAMELVK